MTSMYTESLKGKYEELTAKDLDAQIEALAIEISQFVSLADEREIARHVKALEAEGIPMKSDKET